MSNACESSDQSDNNTETSVLDRDFIKINIQWQLALVYKYVVMVRNEICEAEQFIAKQEPAAITPIDRLTLSALKDYYKLEMLKQRKALGEMMDVEPEMMKRHSQQVQRCYDVINSVLLPN